MYELMPVIQCQDMCGEGDVGVGKREREWYSSVSSR